MKLPRPSRSLFWLALALIVKGAFFAWYLTQTYKHDIDGFWGQSNGDLMTYVVPVEKLLNHQGFKTDDRMPGYPAAYLALRLLFSQATAANVLMLVQLLVSVVSVYVLGLVARLLFGTDRAFYWAYFIYLFSTFVSIFDAYFLTESFATSASVFFLYAWLRFEQEPHRWWPLLWSGIWLAWSVFLKPAHLPLLALPVMIWTLQWLRKKLSLRSVLRYSLILWLPFLLADAAWMVRNYREYRQVIPLLKSPWYAADFWPANYFDIIAFCQAYGEDFSFWFPGTDVRWLLGWKSGQFLPPQKWYVSEDLGPPPAYVYTSAFNRDSITRIRNLYYDVANTPDMDSLRRKAYLVEFKTKLNQYTASIQSEKPLVYYGLAYGRYAFDFLNGTRGYHFLDDIVPMRWPRWLLRAYHYVLVLLPGLLGLWLLSRRGWQKDERLLILPLAVVYCIGVYVLVLRHPETRYLTPFYPFLVLGAAYAFLHFCGELPEPAYRL